MGFFKSAFMMYVDGFRNMTVGKTLWKVVLIKLFVILVVLKLFVHDKSFKSEYKTADERAEFVISNLTKE